VNAKGESYPVGLAYGEWDASKVFAEIARITIQEILGYNAQATGILTGSMTSWNIY
jgi:ABC-type proline/glycine betaine transport system substrate-binding protein